MGRTNSHWLVGVVGCALALVSCHGRPRSDAGVGAAEGDPGSGVVVELDLSAGVPESGGGTFFSLPARRTYVGLVRGIERARDDDDVKGVLVRLGATSLGWARTEELGRLLGSLRKPGRQVVCHAHGLDNAGVWLTAKACDEVWVSPAGHVDTVGLAAQTVYLEGALEKLHVDFELLAMGKYKSAGEPLTRKSPSEESKESLIGVLRSLRKSWLDGVEKARKGEGVRAALEDGPWTVEQALERGLIDHVGFESEARDAIEQAAGTKRSDKRFGGPRKGGSGFDVAEVLRVIAGGDAPSESEPYIAVVPAIGSISMGSAGPFDDEGIASASLERTLRRLAKASEVKAVVLRIDSPGGSALASDLLWHEVMQLRDKKPVIASVGDMAASGGYYIACAANSIVAERTSIIGSIGVVGGKIVLGEALEQVGVTSFNFVASDAPGAEARATYLSALTPWDDPTRERVRTQMRAVYDLFVRRVAAGRAMKEQAVHAVAQGRIWSGAQGKHHGLIDSLGGLSAALVEARKLAELADDTPVRIEGGRESLLDMLLLDDDATEEQVRDALGRLAVRRARVLELAPEALLPHLGSLMPLARGELVAAALPYGTSVK